MSDFDLNIGVNFKLTLPEDWCVLSLSVNP